MYGETKRALKKAFEICNLLYSLGDKYNELKKQTEKINCPTEKEIKHLISNSVDLKQATAIELRERYKQAAININLNEKYGIALLEYISLLEEMSE